MVAPAVLSAVRTYLRTLKEYGIPVSFGVVFGSQATGQADEWSDLDVLVVSPRFDGQIEREDVNRLWRVAARTDSRIEPIPCGERRWREDTGSPIIEVARSQGTPVRLGPTE
jgi:uncharacterized protein